MPQDKLYLLDMFPYPSGKGLHVGHPLGYIGTDVLGRYMRMTGHNVLHTIGYDAFGLPAEQYAVRTGTHPRTTTEANIEPVPGAAAPAGFRRTTSGAASPPPTRSSTAGRSGSSPSCSRPGTTSGPASHGRSPRWSRSSRPAPGRPRTAAAWAELTRAEQHQVLAGYRLAYID